jgi:alkanesulfonate monooxygenase SsuD/methylene tetrahydromethanopterin reductase-like flavin-dependent oxidoreductase (luciferase family)
MQFGYTAMCEQTPVKQLVRDLRASEQAGFDFSVISDHYFPWLEEQGHSGYTWAVLGAAAQATDRLPLMTMVTCSTFRYHLAAVAQKAATVGVLSDGRFTLGLGAGENLNEHVIGTGWPAVRVRTSGWRKRPRSSAPCSPAVTSTSAAATSRWNGPSSTTCPIARCRSGSRSRARSPSSSRPSTRTA